MENQQVSEESAFVGELEMSKKIFGDKSSIDLEVVEWFYQNGLIGGKEDSENFEIRQTKEDFQQLFDFDKFRKEKVESSLKLFSVGHLETLNGLLVRIEDKLKELEIVDYDLNNIFFRRENVDSSYHYITYRTEVYYRSLRPENDDEVYSKVATSVFEKLKKYLQIKELERQL